MLPKKLFVLGHVDIVSGARRCCHANHDTFGHQFHLLKLIDLGPERFLN